jgi:hypothetical protein
MISLKMDVNRAFLNLHKNILFKVNAKIITNAALAELAEPFKKRQSSCLPLF